MSKNDDSKLQKAIIELKRKPGHESVRAILHGLLVNEIGVEQESIKLEENLGDIHGRMDAILGRTIIEIKSNLDREQNAAEEQLLKYLRKKESSGDSYVGIATDGSIFKVYSRAIYNGDDKLEFEGEYKTDIKNPRELLMWLESVLVLQEKLSPEVPRIEMELGRESIFYSKSLRIIRELWGDLQEQGETESVTKFKEWNRLLNTAFLKEEEDVKKDEKEEALKYDLFFQHTYLTFVAKAIATIALLEELPKKAGSFLAGEGFEAINIDGAIESDFFDWVLLHKEFGADLVMDIAKQVQKFDWGKLEADILKVLYENLIDPDQRRTLGEYYTPDWLAEKICRKVIKKPLDMRIIDPACGSGTFLFHAIRLGIEEAENNKISKSETVNKLTENIAGIDIHPVAVIFARVTYLLALFPLFRGADSAKGNFSVPVYLGNSLQWDIEKTTSEKGDLIIEVPAIEKERSVTETQKGTMRDRRIHLRFPEEVAKQKNLFDIILKQMINLSKQKRNKEVFARFLESNGVENKYLGTLKQTFEDLSYLIEQKRNDIWGYVARNLSRPLWLSSEGQKADVVIGNPPWQAYAKMGKTKEKFQKEMKAIDLWSNKATGSQDLATYCFARFMDLYMKKDGQIAFVMPLSVLTRQHGKKFREGGFVNKNFSPRYFEFTEAWGLRSNMKPLFPIPACVIFARRAEKPYPSPTPSVITYISGKLNRRNADLKEAQEALTATTKHWPLEEKLRSKYGDIFKKGADFIPSRFVYIERVSTAFREDVSSPMVQGRVGRNDKKPWKDVEPPKSNVEEEFIYPIYKSESIAHFRVLKPDEGVVPWDKTHSRITTARAAIETGHSGLSNWLNQAETRWLENRETQISFAERLEYYKKLYNQFPIKKIRIVYTASATWPAAAIIQDQSGLIDTSLFWIENEDIEEAYYLMAIFNSEATRLAIEDWQAEGQMGKRHVSRAFFNLPIKKYDSDNALHKKLAASGRNAESFVKELKQGEAENYIKFRGTIRKALKKDGIAGEIDKLVSQLLNL